MCRLLLAHGADARLTNSEGQSALQVATPDCARVIRNPPARIQRAAAAEGDERE
jgi:hypothetical protein